MVKVVLLIGLLLSGSPTFAELNLKPTGFPEPIGFPKTRQPFPTSKPLIELGRHLFYDTRLSADGKLSCATCHQQALAFTDGRKTSNGAFGKTGDRNAMSLVNLAYRTTFGWQSEQTLLEQIERPLFSEHEMGLSKDDVPASIKNDAYYQQAFPKAFKAEGNINWLNIKQALVAFELTLVSGNSRFDRWLFFDEMPNEAAQAGLALFNSEQLACGTCHGGINLNAESDNEFSSNGLVEVETFRTPSLRNVSVTAPYMHDGRFETLEAVIEFYSTGPNPELGLKGFHLDEKQTKELMAFLELLTDKAFLTTPEFSNPWHSAKP